MLQIVRKGLTLPLPLPPSLPSLAEQALVCALRRYVVKSVQRSIRFPPPPWLRVECICIVTPTRDGCRYGQTDWSDAVKPTQLVRCPCLA